MYREKQTSGLLNILWWYYIVAIFFSAVVWKIWKKPSLGILIGYGFLILAETVLIRKSFIVEHFKIELFWSWRAWDVQRGALIG